MGLGSHGDFSGWLWASIGILLCLAGAPRAASATAAAADPPAAGGSPALIVPLEGPIGPASAELVAQGLEIARQRNAPLVLLRMDTPGGLDSAMRTIVKAILASPIPVAGYVAPRGARAASAGTYILYACHFAAMAPGTNLGAATPVAIGAPGIGSSPEPAEPGKGDKGKGHGDPMTAKRVSDASAYIRGLAQLRGRNAEWAEQAVREAASLSAEEAVAERVIDVVADSEAELLRALDGRETLIAGEPRRMATREARTEVLDPGWRLRLLQTLADPSLALILLMIGVYGLIFEFASPGFGVAGAVGAVSLLLGLYALQLLPINYAGLALLALGIALMVAEAIAPSHGVLALAGTAAFMLGGVMLVREGVPGFAIPWSLVAALGATSAGFSLIVVRLALEARRRPQRAGMQALVGLGGVVYKAEGSEGWATVRGERWKVRGQGPLGPGDRVRVVGARGLVLEVAPRSSNEEGEQP